MRDRQIATAKPEDRKRPQRLCDMVGPHRQRYIGTIDPGLLEPEPMEQRRPRVSDRPAHDPGHAGCPGDFHRGRLCEDFAATSQEGEKLQKWKPEDREVISFDTLKQLRTSAFEPIGTDRAENLRAFGRNIVVEVLITEFPHFQLWPAHRMPQARSSLNRTDRSHKLVRATTQSLELDASFVEIRGLIEPTVTADQDLI